MKLGMQVSLTLLLAGIFLWVGCSIYEHFHPQSSCYIPGEQHMGQVPPCVIVE